MNSYKRYLYLFLGTAAALMVLVGGLNLFVDPYDRFGLNRLGVYISAEREFKSTEFPRYAPEAVLLGNSRAAIINADGLKGHRFFNAAFGSAVLEEMCFFVDHYVKTQKLVVLSLDAFAFASSSNVVKDPFTPLTLRRSLDYIFNLQNVEYSVRTIRDHLKGKHPSLAANGSFWEPNWAAEADQADPETANRRVQALVETLAPYRFDPARLDQVREMRDLLERRNIRLLVYLTPINRRVWLELEGTPAQAEMNRTREALKALFPGLVDLTESEFSDPEYFFRGDPMHFRSAVGQQLLNERVLETGS